MRCASRKHRGRGRNKKLKLVRSKTEKRSVTTILITTLSLTHSHSAPPFLSPPTPPTLFLLFLVRHPFFRARCSHHCSSIHFRHLSSLTLFSSSAKTSRCPRMDSTPIFFSHNRPKEKVIVIMGATGASKSSLSIDLATCFPFSEIINSDKMEVYRGLDITTNKIPIHEHNAVPHHLLGNVHPENGEFTPFDFARWLCHLRINLRNRWRMNVEMHLTGRFCDFCTYFITI